MVHPRLPARRCRHPSGWRSRLRQILPRARPFHRPCHRARRLAPRRLPTSARPLFLSGFQPFSTRQTRSKPHRPPLRRRKTAPQHKPRLQLQQHLTWQSQQDGDPPGALQKQRIPPDRPRCSHPLPAQNVRYQRHRHWPHPDLLQGNGRN